MPSLPDTLPARADPAAAEAERDVPPPRATPQQPDTVDTLPPPPTLPAMPPVGEAGWARGVWEWDRDALERLPDLSVLALLERVPGIVPVRADVANQPEGAAVFGATAGGIRWVVDGFELDPLVTPSFDPSRLPLLGLARVRVERRVTGVTVRLWTLSPSRPHPESIIEAGTGDLDINLFRGVLLAPRVLGGPLALGFERLAADGSIPGGSTNHTGGWVKWTWVRGPSGIQLEYRQTGLERSGIGADVEGSTAYWAVRARSGLGPVTGEVYAGGSTVEDQVGEELRREGTPHGGLRVRAGFDAPVPVQASADLRLRDHPRLPGREVEMELSARPLTRLAVEASVIQGWWEEGEPTGRWSARAVAGPLLGVSVFGELFGGGPLVGEGVGFRAPSTDSIPLEISRDGLRAGLEVRLGAAMLGAAVVRTTVDTVPGFGLPTEPVGLGTPGGEVDALEVTARLPTGWEPLTVQGWYVGTAGTDTTENRLYLPRHWWRAGLVYHHQPLPSGNLEIFARLQHVFRGGMTVASAVDPEEPQPVPPALASVGPYRSTNLELSIRVLTVRAFIRWENLFHRLRQEDLIGYPRPGQNVLYGVKWHFEN